MKENSILKLYEERMKDAIHSEYHWHVDKLILKDAKYLKSLNKLFKKDVIPNDKNLPINEITSLCLAMNYRIEHDEHLFEYWDEMTVIKEAQLGILANMCEEINAFLEECDTFKEKIEVLMSWCIVARGGGGDLSSYTLTEYESMKGEYQKILDQFNP